MRTSKKLDRNTAMEIFLSLQDIISARNSDVLAFNGLETLLNSLRKTNRLPTSSTDTTPNDLVGDFNYDEDYFYLAVNNAGVVAWRRIALGVW
jgi:hypothetical protein